MFHFKFQQVHQNFPFLTFRVKRFQCLHRSTTTQQTDFGQYLSIMYYSFFGITTYIALQQKISGNNMDMNQTPQIPQLLPSFLQLQQFLYLEKLKHRKQTFVITELQQNQNANAGSLLSFKKVFLLSKQYQSLKLHLFQILCLLR